jgi:hypothetical protein
MSALPVELTLTAGGYPATGAKVQTGVPAWAVVINTNPHTPITIELFKRFLFIIISLCQIIDEVK